MEAAQQLDELCERYWALKERETPLVVAMTTGSTSITELMRESPEDYRRRGEAASELARDLQAVDQSALSQQDSATYWLLERELRLIENMVRLGSYQQPQIYPMGANYIVNHWAQGAALSSRKDLELYLERLQNVAPGLESVLRAMQEGVDSGVTYPRLVVNAAISVAHGLVAMPSDQSSYMQPVKRWVEQNPQSSELAEQAVSIIDTSVYPVLKNYAEFLADVLAPVARESLSCRDVPHGDELYRHYIQFYTSLDMDPEEIHQLGLSEVQRIRQRMEQVATEAGFEGNLDGYIEHIANDPAQVASSAEELRQQIEVLSKRIDLLIPEFFGHTPRTTYGVRTMQESVSAKSPPAYAQPNLADNSTPGIHWVTAHPEKLPKYLHIPLALHEAWPGHLMHIALSQEMDDLPAFRRSPYDYSMCMEGWALYSEQLGEEMGLYDTPDKLYGRLETEMWRAVRLVVDSGIHWKGWSREQAIDFFKEHMALPLPTVEAEVDRYVGWPAQALSYQLGNIKFMELRRHAEAELGENFDRRSFHDTLMQAGAVTLDVLGDFVDAWIAEQKLVS